MTVHRPITGAGGLFSQPRRAAEAPRQPIQARDTLKSKSTVRALYAIAEGPIRGLMNGSKDVYLDDVPITPAQGPNNYQGINLFFTDGYPDQPAPVGFPDTATIVPVNAAVTQAAPVIRAVTDTDATAVIVAVRVPALFSQNPSTGDVSDASAIIYIGVQPAGQAMTEVRGDTIQGQRSSPYERQYRIQLFGPGPWNIRVRRETADSGSPNLQNATIWSSMVVIRDYVLSYADTCMLGLTADADLLQGRIPRVAVEIDAVLVEVPTNYDSIARTYAGVWDGTFKTAFSRNPVWLLYALLRNRRFGLGAVIDPAAIDKWSFEAAARWCDERVPDGRGGVEPRFSFDGVIRTSDDAWRLLTLVAGAFRGMLHWASGTVRLSVDRPADPVALITPANVVGGRIGWEGTGIKSRPTVALVRWTDPENAWQTSVETVEDRARIDSFGWRPSEVTLLGCASQGQAQREARWIVDTAWTDTQSATWTMGVEGAHLMPGDIVAVHDTSLAGARVGGRLVSTSGTQLTLDAPVTIEPGEAYEVLLVRGDGSVARIPITTPPGTVSILTLTAAPSPAPVAGAVFILTSNRLAPRLVRVLSVSETEEGDYRFSGIAFDPTKQNRIEQDVQAPRIPWSSYPTGVLLAPLALSILDAIVPVGGRLAQLTTLSWQAPNDPRVMAYDVNWRRAGQGWSEDRTTSALTAEFPDLGDGSFEFRARSIGFDGRRSPYATLGPVSVAGLTGTPPDVTLFRIAILDRTATLSWAAVDIANLSHYEIRHSPSKTEARWESATVLIERAAATSTQVAALIGTYMIKAVTTRGVTSASPALVVSDIAGLDGLNVVAEQIEHPAFRGVKDGVYRDAVANTLRLDFSSSFYGPDTNAPFYGPDPSAPFYDANAWRPSGTYSFAETFDLGEVYTSRVSGTIEARGNLVTENLFVHANVFTLANIFGDEPTEWAARLEMRTTLDDPGAAPVWSAWRPLVLGDYLARAFQFRAVLESLAINVTPIISKLSALIDMPDRIEAGDDIVVPTSGLRVTFVPPFRELRGVSAIIQDAATGDYYTVTNKDVTGFDIVFRNAAGTPVQRVMDYVVKGHGRQQ